MPEEETSNPGERERADAGSRVRAAEIYCESCDRLTPHRILHVDRAGNRPSAPMRGIGRCKACGLVHPFSSTPPATVRFAEILSEGRASTRRLIDLPRGKRLQIGSGVPESDVPVVIRKIENRQGRPVPQARAEEIGTLWVTRDLGAVVPVSIVEGRRTRPARLIVPRETVLVVGERIRVEETEIVIAGLRARARSWRKPGDAFPAGEVIRLYGRRHVMPPAGSSDWRSEREIPSSRASSVSRSGRSRSSPGVSRARRPPRAANAEGGATVHSSRPS